MPGPEILDRSPVEILLDHCRTDIGSPRNRGRISELLGHAAHDGRHRPLLRCLGLGKAVALRMLGELNRSEQRSAPRSEILSGELVSEVDLDVVVEALGREVPDPVVPAVPEHAAAARQLQQLADRVR